MPQSTKTAIMVIGGAEDKVHGREILHTFFYRSGSSEARIAIIPSASREPSIIGDRYQGIFEEMGAKEIMVLDIRDRGQLFGGRAFQACNCFTARTVPAGLFDCAASTASTTSCLKPISLSTTFKRPVRNSRILA